MPRMKSIPGLVSAADVRGAGAADRRTIRSGSNQVGQVHRLRPPHRASPLGRRPTRPAMRRPADGHAAGGAQLDFMSMLFVFMLATFIGIGVIRRVSRLLHTPLMSLTNAISAISVVGAIIVAGGTHYPTAIRIIGAIALFASMTNIISGFLITDRMLKMFKTREEVKA